MLDGVEVRKDMRGWDVLLGNGIVSHVANDGSFRVKFGAREQNYRADGTTNNSGRRFFWQPLDCIYGLRPGAEGRKELEIMAVALASYRIQQRLASSTGELADTVRAEFVALLTGMAQALEDATTGDEG